MIAKTLKPFKVSDLGSKLSGFFLWWKGEMKSILPHYLASLFLPKGKKLVINLAKEAIGFEEFSEEGKLQTRKSLFPKKVLAQDDNTIFNQISSEFEKVFIEINPSFLFKKRIRVPKAGPGEIRKILDLQIERVFPLEKGHLYFSWSKPENGWVMLYIIKRVNIDPVLKAIKKSSLKFNRVVVAPAGGIGSAAFNVPLAQPSFSLKLFRNAFTYSLLFWGLTAFAFWFYLGSVVANLEKEIDEIQEVVAAEMTSVEAHETRLQKQRVIKEILRGNSLSAILNTLSEFFPENSWVDNFSMARSEIILSGTHASPPELVSALSNTGVFKDVRLTSSEEASGVARFQIILTLNPSPIGEAGR